MVADMSTAAFSSFLASFYRGIDSNKLTAGEYVAIADFITEIEQEILQNKELDTLGKMQAFLAFTQQKSSEAGELGFTVLQGMGNKALAYVKSNKNLHKALKAELRGKITNDIANKFKEEGEYTNITKSLGSMVEKLKAEKNAAVEAINDEYKEQIEKLKRQRTIGALGLMVLPIAIIKYFFLTLFISDVKQERNDKAKEVKKLYKTEIKEAKQQQKEHKKYYDEQIKNAKEEIKNLQKERSNINDKEVGAIIDKATANIVNDRGGVAREVYNNRDAQLEQKHENDKIQSKNNPPAIPPRPNSNDEQLQKAEKPSQVKDASSEASQGLQGVKLNSEQEYNYNNVPHVKSGGQQQQL